MASITTVRTHLRRPWSVPLPRVLTMRYAVQALGVALLVRGLSTLWWALAGDPVRHGLRWELSKFDGGWFRLIAEHWYAPGGTLDNELRMAFFPGYPLLVGLLERVTGRGFVAAGLAVSVCSTAVVVVLLAQLAAWSAVLVEIRPDGSADPDLRSARRIGLIAVALAMGMPMALILTSTYSEALFVALCLASLTCVLRGRFLWAVLPALLAGVTRTTSVALFLTLVLCALANPRSWRAWLAALVAPAGWAGWLMWVQHRLVLQPSWFALERTYWHSSFDGGGALWMWLRAVVLSQSSTHAVLMMVIVATVVAAVHGLTDPAPWPLTVFAAGIAAAALLSDGVITSRARLVVPAMTLVIPVSRMLARSPRHSRLAIVVLWCVFGAYATINLWFVSPDGL